MRALLRRLHERVKRPVVSGAEHEYLATQVLAEYLSVHKEIDGVIFGSVQEQGGKNIALLSKALGPFDADRGGFFASPIEFVHGSAQVVDVITVKYEWRATTKRP